MLRRIGQFFKDIAETIKRERGKLQINSNRVSFKIKTGSLSSASNDVSINDSRTLPQLFQPMDIKDDTPPVNIKGKADYSHLPGVSSASTDFPLALKTITEDSFQIPLQDCSCELDERPFFKELTIDQFLQLPLSDAGFEKNPWIDLNIKESGETGNFQLSFGERDFLFHSTVVKDYEMNTRSDVKDLEMEFWHQRRDSFHFENTLGFNPFIESYDPITHVNCYHSLASAMRFPVKRHRVSKGGYEREELKRALSFIVKRYESNSRLNIVGIYKNVPVDNAERLTFNKDNALFFYMKKGNYSRSILMDVLVVKTKEGRYHVGPIIRKA